ncbi:MAG TPA: hydroxysqualene dehydroxylase HpnE [Candidatus Eisenbacteria bacterium]|nr:hydroxysqualene dehydroxylase HpnE [Candidatus Eisenbacteria bacterium]
MTAPPDVVVIGAGFAGVAAATALADRGARVLVLETRQRPGGRAYSWTDPTTGEVRDNGQHVLASFYDETHRLLARLGTAEALQADRTFRLRVEVRHRGGYELACPSWPAPWSWAGGILGASGLSLPSRLAALGLQGRARSLLARNGSGADTTIQSWLSNLGRGTEDLEGLLWALAIAALNDLPGEASATLFARVLGRLLAAPTERTGLAMPRRALGDLIAGYEDFLAQRGGEVLYRTTALGVRIDGGRATGVSLLGGTRLDAGAVILTVPHERITWMLRPELAEPYRAIAAVPWSPIVSTMHVFDRPVLPERMVALLGTRTQWAFDRGEAGAGRFRVGTVRSAAFADAERDVDLIAREAEADLLETFPAARDARLLETRAYKERRATMRSTPAAQRVRPGTETAIQGLYLAGDWTATGLPPTIEGAVLSGHRAAELAR